MKIEHEIAFEWRLETPGCSLKFSLSSSDPHPRVLADIFRPLTIHSQEASIPFLFTYGVFPLHFRYQISLTIGS